MKYSAEENILPREQSEYIEILTDFSNLINEIVNFGTHLIKWDTENKVIGDESIVPVLFMRNILELADSISILIKKSSIDSSKNLLRSLLENIFGLEYLLEKDSANRSLSFIVWLTHKDLKFYEKLDNQTLVSKQFKTEFSKDNLIQKPELINNIEYLSHKKNSEELLKLPQYSKIENEYQQTEKKMKNPTWYSLYSGPKNIEQLAKYLKHNAIYEVMYRGYSGNVHATDIYKGKLLPNNEGSFDIKQIRNPKDAQSVTIDTINFLLMVYLKYFGERIPERKIEFRDWYLEFKIEFDKLRNNKN